MRPTIRVLAAIALVAFAFGAHADWINKSGERLPDGDDRKSLGSFGAQLILVSDDQQMFKVWGTPGETVNVSTVRSVSIGGQADAFVVFSGCTPSKSGQCDVSMQFRIYQPNGKVYASTPPMEVGKANPLRLHECWSFRSSTSVMIASRPPRQVRRVTIVKATSLARRSNFHLRSRPPSEA